jgi:hypothetical protein
VRKRGRRKETENQQPPRKKTEKQTNHNKPKRWQSWRPVGDGDKLLAGTNKMLQAD